MTIGEINEFYREWQIKKFNGKPAPADYAITEDKVIKIGEMTEKLLQSYTPEEWKAEQDHDSKINNREDFRREKNAPDNELALEFLWEQYQYFKALLRLEYGELKEYASMCLKNPGEVLELYQQEKA